jgi:hypothetical protein
MLVKYLAFILIWPLLGVATGNPGPRHLTFAYAEYPTAKIEGPATKFTGPGTGTLDVTVTGRAADGGLVVQVRDWWWNAVRPRQTANCEIYPNGDFVCDQYPALSEGQAALLPLLAEDFYPDSATQWQIKRWMRQSYFCGYYSATSVTNYAVTRTLANGDLDIEGAGSYRVPCIHEPIVHQRISLTYDPSETLPVLVHEETTGTLGSVLSGRSVDLKLVKDSYQS